MDPELSKLMNHDSDYVRQSNSLSLVTFNPYNINNIEITLEDIQCILHKYGISQPIRNLELYKRAFIHSSYVKRIHSVNISHNILPLSCPSNCIDLKNKSNDRLEFVGDGVLELVIKHYLYRRFPKECEGFMTEKKIALVNNEHIGSIALKMNLNKWIIISKHEEIKNLRNNVKKMGCLFEAFIGAIFLDYNQIDPNSGNICSGNGFQMAQIFIENIFETFVDWSVLVLNDDNFKNILQVLIQKEFKVTPHYVEISRNTSTGFEIGVYLCIGTSIHHVNISNSIPYENCNSFDKIRSLFHDTKNALITLGVGVHKIKKKAEQMASECALNNIKYFTTY